MGLWPNAFDRPAVGKCREKTLEGPANAEDEPMKVQKCRWIFFRVEQMKGRGPLVCLGCTLYRVVFDGRPDFWFCILEWFFTKILFA